MRNTASCQHGLRQAAGGGEDRVDQDARHQRARPPEAIGNHAEAIPPARRGQQRDRPERARGRRRDAEVAHHRRQHQRVEHHVERVEHPAEPRPRPARAAPPASPSRHQPSRPGVGCGLEVRTRGRAVAAAAWRLDAQPIARRQLSRTLPGSGVSTPSRIERVAAAAARRAALAPYGRPTPPSDSTVTSVSRQHLVLAHDAVAAAPAPAPPLPCRRRVCGGCAPADSARSLRSACCACCSCACARR